MSHSVNQVGDGTFFVQGDAVNWVLLTDGDHLTLIDAGYPGDYDDVVASIRSIGFTPEQITAVLITHAHVDHIGSLPRLLADVSPPVYTSEQESKHAHRDYLEQASRADVTLRSWRPKVAVWGLHVLKSGGTEDVRVPQAAPFPESFDVPGNPVPVVTPGHTSGHTCYFLPEAGAMVTGDALATGHPISSRKGPQLLENFFHHDPAGARKSLDLLTGHNADIVLPGHGPVWQGPIAEAVERALAP